jgi:hypothetical protein
MSWKYVQWEPCYSKPTEGQTDMTKVIIAFRNFAQAPKTYSNNGLHSYVYVCRSLSWNVTLKYIPKGIETRRIYVWALNKWRMILHWNVIKN